MGTWGPGILQNDTALDRVDERADKLLSAMSSFAENPGIESVAQLGAAVGLMLQCSSGGPEVGSPDHVNLVNAIKANKPFLAKLPRRAQKTLRLVAADRGGELPKEAASLPADLAMAFYGFKAAPPYLMAYYFTTRHDELFRHAKVIGFTQRLADELVDETDEGFSNEELVSKLPGYGDFMGSFALLLIIDPCRVEPGKFTKWREQFRQVWNNLEPTDNEDWRTFLVEYRSCVELALQYGLWKHS